MHRFWEVVIRPLLDAVEPETIVEVGAAQGAHTRLLAEYATEHGRKLHSIDPSPDFDFSALAERRQALTFHRARSLDALSAIGPADVALLDGDHNWYTVHGELRLLREGARAAGRATPVIVCHDIGWPYGRRDLYYDPETVPAEYRQPWERAGVDPGSPALVPNAGLNAHLCNAIREGGPRNGVLTAIEDFTGEADEEVELIELPVLWGLGVLVPETRLEAHPGLRGTIERWGATEGRAALTELAERERQALTIATQVMGRRLEDGGPAAAERPNAQVESAGGRRFQPDLPPATLAALQRGILAGAYRGLRFLKSPFDIVLYQELIGRLKPRTVIELGTKEGGSALWFADALSAHGVQGRVLSIDLENPPALDDPRISFLRGDAARLEDVLPAGTMAGLEHPLLVVEDSAHTFEVTTAALEFFHAHLRKGEYIVVEDGVLADFPDPAYGRYEDGPNRAVSALLDRYPGAYEIDADLCDRYGHNVTWSPNGWLRRL